MDMGMKTAEVKSSQCIVSKGSGYQRDFSLLLLSRWSLGLGAARQVSLP